MSPGGKVTNLYNFCAQTDCIDGDDPDGGLVQATDGNSYGTTKGIRYHSDDSVIFSISPQGTFTRLYTFNKNKLQAANGGVVQANHGSFFGTTGVGFASCSKNCGSVFNLSVGLGPFVKLLPCGGKAGRVVEILGNNLTGTSSVTFHGRPATFSVQSDTLIMATVPTGATTGRIQVTAPSGRLTSNAVFIVRP